jgi:type IV secretory pathway VirB4 component
MAKKAEEKKSMSSKPGQPTQRYLDIAEIREDVVVMKDGTLRSVIMVSSINFALKSRDEQQGMIQSYMQFLNSIDYPLQIVVQSRKMDIDSYMNSLAEQEKEMKNELLKNQIQDYAGFVQQLVDLGEIMQKRFYVIVPYDPVTDKKQGFFARLSAALSPSSVVKLKLKEFRRRRHDLMQRVELIRNGLTSMGLESVQLDTQGLIELYYTAYNPDVYDYQELKDISKIRLEQGF